jgi:RNA polymerase sigma-70 factor (ECF subfamily)
MARRLDNQAPAVQLEADLVSAPYSSASVLTPNALRILEAIDSLPEDEREAFDLVRIQGMSQAEAARVLGVSAMTVNRRLSRSLQLLTSTLKELSPNEAER